MFISHFKSLSGKARHQGLLTHDREGSFTTEMGKRLPQRSPPRSAGDAARLYAPYHLPSSLDGAEYHHDLQKRLTRRRQQQANDAHTSLIKLRGSGLSSGHFTLSHYAELFSETENCENTKRATRSLKPQVFSRKCAPASSLSSASCSLGMTSTPFSHCTAPWRSSSSPTSSSSCPTPQSTSSPPDIWLPVPNHNFQARKKTPPCGRVFSFSGC